MLVSGVQQNDSGIHIHIPILFQILTVSFSEEFGHGLNGCLWLRVSHKATMNPLPELQSSQDSSGRRSAFKLTYVSVSWHQVFTYMDIHMFTGLKLHCPETLVLCMWTSPLGYTQHGSLLASKWRFWKREERDKEKLVFLESNLGSNIQYLCYILFIRSKSLGSAHTQWQTIAQGHEYQGRSSLRVIIESIYLNSTGEQY